MRYIEGLLAAPLLKQKVIKTTAHAFEFADDVIMKWGPRLSQRSLIHDRHGNLR